MLRLRPASDRGSRGDQRIPESLIPAEEYRRRLEGVRLRMATLGLYCPLDRGRGADRGPGHARLAAVRAE